jgi:radical SAM superfamily enzyme YgiQ (UPF0313 family)
MVYKKGPPYRVRPVQDICDDIHEARRSYGEGIETLFFPAGNTIAMPTDDLIEICAFAKKHLPMLRRITVYGSSQYIAQKGPEDLKRLKGAGLTRIHVGLESGDDEVLRRVKKGTCAAEQIRAGLMVMETGLELSIYIILGLGGTERTEDHASATAEALNHIAPHFVRLRTLVPKINTLLLHQIKKGRFQILSPHQVLKETRLLIDKTTCRTTLVSDHYTNYINLEGSLPDDKAKLINRIDHTLRRDENDFRPFFIGTQ